MRARGFTYLRFTLLAALLLAAAGCSSTSLRPVEDFSPSKIAAEIQVGDQIRVTTLSGKVFELEVTGVEANLLHGRTAEGRKFRVDYEVIRTIEVERVSGWKVVTGLSATLTTLFVTAAVVAIYLFVHGF